ncbi:hypothetical protein, partial [Microbacterium sp. Bi128]|uniref:hypothetical protein n=1 Tax=Microbacterium sp. Bi128 TaxID=2821115 RepID=UPI001E3E7C23
MKMIGRGHQLGTFSPITASAISGARPSVTVAALIPTVSIHPVSISPPEELESPPVDDTDRNLTRCKAASGGNSAVRASTASQTPPLIADEEIPTQEPVGRVLQFRGITAGEDD